MGLRQEKKVLGAPSDSKHDCSDSAQSLPFIIIIIFILERSKRIEKGVSEKHNTEAFQRNMNAMHLIRGNGAAKQQPL